ncbi:NAD-binding protein [Pseudoalteromonas piscicida]|uniref:NAD-binding protein n=1 Tax=Pseudoalteromonas piscicida TaxID=43662 RepID=UPI003C7A2987
MKSIRKEKTQLNIVGIIVLTCLIVLTISLGIYGFSSVYIAKKGIAYPELTRWFDVLYSTIKLFSLISSPAEESLKHWAISAARLTAACSVFFSIAFASIYAASSWFKSNVLVKFYKNHYVVFGLNSESKFLIEDLIKHKKKVVLIESDHANPMLKEFYKKPIAIILGDPTTLNTHLKASVIKAHSLVIMTGCDLGNLAALKTLVESTYKPSLHCHIAINNVMSYKLFEPKAFYAIESIKKRSPGLLLNVFSTYEQIAIDLVSSLRMGSNADTLSSDAKPVSVLIAGFGSIGEAILKELLLMSHFFNQKKVNIKIVSDEPNDFFTTYHQVLQHINGNGLDLWDIEFVASMDAIHTPSDFHHIIACYDDEDLALKAILRLYDVCTVQAMQKTDSTTSFHYLSTLKHDIEHDQIKPFGSLENTLNVAGILNNTAENLAQKSHHLYAKAELGIAQLPNEQANTIIEQHDAKTQNPSLWLHWVNQPLFKRRSNFTEKRHIPIKLLALGATFTPSLVKDDSPTQEPFNAELPYLEEFTDLDIDLIHRWILNVQKVTRLTDKQLTERIHILARVEHNRWNAFHIVNNWRYGTEKNEALKTHDCLLSWQELERKRHETIKYDYKNIYHIPETLAQI